MSNNAPPYAISGRRGLMLVISSPSGAGKTSLSRRLVADHESLDLSISCTTRSPPSIRALAAGLNDAHRSIGLFHGDIDPLAFIRAGQFEGFVQDTLIPGFEFFRAHRTAFTSLMSSASTMHTIGASHLESKHTSVSAKIPSTFRHFTRANFPENFRLHWVH